MWNFVLWIEEKGRIAAIAINPKLILLDEPMAGMNQEEKEDMARFIIDLNREEYYCYYDRA